MTRDILLAIFEGYALPLDGEHGPRHWGRVLVNGTKLAGITGADFEVVRMFALFHDCRRRNEGTDRKHGRRGGAFAGKLHVRGLLDLSDEQFALLEEACDGHTEGRVEAHPTIQTCWDADRLDLGRVGIRLDPRRLCTPAARDFGTMDWANDRARSNHEESVVRTWLAWAGTSTLQRGPESLP